MKKVSVILSVFALVFGVVGKASASLMDGLVAYYQFDGNANDVSGNGNHGLERNGVALTSDRFGNPNSAYNFDGIDDYIEVPDSYSLDGPSNTNEVTISSWVNITTLGGDGFPQHYVVDSRGGLGTGFTFNVDTELIQVGVQGLDKWGEANFYCTLQTGIWHHVAGTFDGSEFIAYVDGIEIDSIAFIGNILPSNVSLYIGQRYTFNERFHGNIDEIRIYNRALSRTEIQQLATVPIPSAVWIFFSGFIGLIGLRIKLRKEAK